MIWRQDVEVSVTITKPVFTEHFNGPSTIIQVEQLVQCCVCTIHFEVNDL